MSQMHNTLASDISAWSSCANTTIAHLKSFSGVQTNSTEVMFLTVTHKYQVEFSTQIDEVWGFQKLRLRWPSANLLGSLAY